MTVMRGEGSVMMRMSRDEKDRSRYLESHVAAGYQHEQEGASC